MRDFPKDKVTSSEGNCTLCGEKDLLANGYCTTCWDRQTFKGEGFPRVVSPAKYKRSRKPTEPSNS